MARSVGVKRLGSDDGDHASDMHVDTSISNVDTVRVGLWVAWLKGDGSVGPVVVEVKGLCRVNVVNANVVLLNPSGVRALFATEVVERVVVDIILGALVIEVNLLFAVELTVALVLKLGAESHGKDIEVLLFGNIKFNFGLPQIISSHNDKIIRLIFLDFPAPVSVVTASSLSHGNSDFSVFKNVEGFIVGFLDINDFNLGLFNHLGGSDGDGE